MGAQESFGLVEAFTVAASSIGVLLAVIGALLVVIYRNVRADIEQTQRDRTEDRKELDRLRDLLANEYARQRELAALSSRMEEGFRVLQQDMKDGFTRIFDKLDSKADKTTT